MELHCIDYELQLHAPRGAQSRARIPPNPTLAYEAEAVCAVAHRLRDEQQAAFRLAAVCLAHRHRASKFMPAESVTRCAAGPGGDQPQQQPLRAGASGMTAGPARLSMATGM